MSYKTRKIPYSKHRQTKHKYGKIDGWNSKRGKLHMISSIRRYTCGQNIDDRTDILCSSIPKSKIAHNVFCKKCFPDVVVYPDASLDDELFNI